MKTSNWIKASCFSLGASLLLSACGGSGGNGQIPSGRAFDSKTLQIITPAPGSTKACLFPQIEVAFNKEDGICGQQNLNPYFQLRSNTGGQTVYDLSTAWSPVPDADAAKLIDTSTQCLIKTSSAKALPAKTEFILSQGQALTNQGFESSGHDITFTTGSFQDNRNCSGNLALNDNRSWQETDLLQIGGYDNNGKANYDPSSLTDILLQAVTQGSFQQLIGIGQQPDYNFRVTFNDPVSDFSLSSDILVYKVDAAAQLVDGVYKIINGDQLTDQDFHLFNSSFLTGCPEGKDNSCIYLNKDDPSIVEVHHPENSLWESGTYIVILATTLQSQAGRYLDASHYNMFTIQ